MGNFLICIQGVKDPSEAQEESEISLKMPQCKRASARVEERISWFFSSCSRKLGFLSSYNGDLRDPLVWPQERPVSMPVAMGLSGILSHQCQVLSPGLEPRPETYVSSPVLTWILGFLWSLHRGVRPRLERDMHLCFPPQL